MSDGGELAQRLAHEARLQTHVAVAHVAFELRLRGERRDRVDDDEIDGAAPHQALADVERLLAGVRLGDEQLVRLDADGAGVGDIERVLGIDEGADAARALRLGDGVQREGGLAGRLRAVDLHHASARVAADAGGEVEGERAGADHTDRLHVDVVSQRHDRPFPNCFSRDDSTPLSVRIFSAVVSDSMIECTFFA